MTVLRPTTGYTPGARIYNLAVVNIPVDGMEISRPILTLERYVPALNYLIREATSMAGANRQTGCLPTTSELSDTRAPCVQVGGLRLPQRLTRPFILQASRGEILRLRVTNYVAKVPLALALIDDDYGMDRSDRTQEPARNYEMRNYLWCGTHEGIFPIFNSADDETTTRRQLLGVLIVEP